MERSTRLDLDRWNCRFKKVDALHPRGGNPRLRSLRQPSERRDKKETESYQRSLQFDATRLVRTIEDVVLQLEVGEGHERGESGAGDSAKVVRDDTEMRMVGGVRQGRDTRARSERRKQRVCSQREMRKRNLQDREN